MYNLVEQQRTRFVCFLVLITNCVYLLIIRPPSFQPPLLCFKLVRCCLVYGHLHNLIKVQKFNTIYWKLLCCHFNVHEENVRASTLWLQRFEKQGPCVAASWA